MPSLSQAACQPPAWGQWGEGRANGEGGFGAARKSAVLGETAFAGKVMCAARQAGTRLVGMIVTDDATISASVAGNCPGTALPTSRLLRRDHMKPAILALSIVVSLGAFSGTVAAKGCLKGAAVGGVAGHVAGKHGLMGAAAGCVVGRHVANKKAREQAAQTPATAAPAPAPAPAQAASVKK